MQCKKGPSISDTVITSLESLGDCKNLLCDGESTVELGASIFQESSKASGMHNTIIRQSKIYCKYSAASYSVHGIVVVQCGQAKSTPIKRADFVFPHDPTVIDNITKKTLMDLQKPVAFYKSLLQLYSVKGEWILNGYSVIGNTYFNLL